MPSPPPGPNRFNDEPSTELPDVHAATVPAPSVPPPLPLIRRKAQAEAAPFPGTAQWQNAAPVTAPWPMPPSSRAPGVEHAEASTPFNSAVDIFEEDSRATETPEPEPDFRAATNPWWRRIKAPSRQLRMGALIAALAAAVGWSAGAKPWASHRTTTNKVLAAKAGGNSAGKRAPGAHGPQAAAHPNRRVAVNAKSKAAAAAPAQPKASAKPTAAAKPAVSAKQLAKPAAHAAAKTTANKAPAKAKAKPTTPSKKSAVAAKPKAVSAPTAATKAKAKPAN